MLLVIDNYDSFTFNLVQYLGEMGVEMQVHRNDQISVDRALALAPERVLISPGPCSPREAGLSNELILPSPTRASPSSASASATSASPPSSAPRSLSTGA